MGDGWAERRSEKKKRCLARAVRTILRPCSHADKSFLLNPPHPSFPSFPFLCCFFPARVKNVVRDFQMQVARVATPAYDEATLAQLPTTSYEFPNGYNDMFGVERFRYPEHLFNSEFRLGDTAGSNGTPLEQEHLPVHSLITQSIEACDTDTHQNLWSSLVLAGGTSLIHGYQDRLQSELNQHTSMVKRERKEGLREREKKKNDGGTTGITDRVLFSLADMQTRSCK